MDSPYENLVQGLKSLPGLGYRSAEKIALHLLVEKPEKAETLSTLITEAGNLLGPCETCGNLSEEKTCSICDSEDRDKNDLRGGIGNRSLFNGKIRSLKGSIMYFKVSYPRFVDRPEQLNFPSFQTDWILRAERNYSRAKMIWKARQLAIILRRKLLEKERSK